MVQKTLSLQWKRRLRNDLVHAERVSYRSRDRHILKATSTAHLQCCSRAIWQMWLVQSLCLICSCLSHSSIALVAWKQNYSVSPGKGKGKFHPRTDHDGPEWKKTYSCTLSLTSTSDGVGGQRHAPAALPPGKTQYPLYRRLGAPQGRSGRVRNISPPPGFDPRTVQLVASRYPDPTVSSEGL